MLADYDAHHPNEIFAERGPGWLTLEDAYAVQHAVAKLRLARGEQCLGYKVGCVGPAIQKQLGLPQPVRGYLWASEQHVSGCPLDATRFANLAAEGELALRLRCDVPTGTTRGVDLFACVERWFPVLELHNAVFRGPVPTSQELIAGNAMHAGYVLPADRQEDAAGGAESAQSLDALRHAQIHVALDGVIVETTSATELPGGPLGSLRWLVASLIPRNETLRANMLVLTGSPGRLFPIRPGMTLAVESAGQRVEAFIGGGDRRG